MFTMSSKHEDFWEAEGFSPVAGVDEAGRGPLAGPVVACALILPPGIVIEGVNDSKKLTPPVREKLAEKITKVAVSFAYGIVSAAEIDRINILRATMKAMQQAISGLNPAAKIALVDGPNPPVSPCRVVCIPGGDSASRLIAGASILAKVKRDNIMAEIHEKFPEYGFEKHKGYGTKAHREAIIYHGLCPEHRRTFGVKKI